LCSSVELNAPVQASSPATAQSSLKAVNAGGDETPLIGTLEEGTQVTISTPGNDAEGEDRSSEGSSPDKTRQTAALERGTQGTTEEGPDGKKTTAKKVPRKKKAGTRGEDIVARKKKRPRRGKGEEKEESVDVDCGDVFTGS
jgi:hypothetical protein